jgi:hypothetical protein
MPNVLSRNGKRVACTLRVAVLAVALGLSPAALLASGSAHAIEAEGTAEVDSTGSASGTGEGVSSSGQESNASATAETSPTGGSATGTGETSADAEQGKIGAETEAAVDTSAEKWNGTTTATATSTAIADVDPGKKTVLTANATANSDDVPDSAASTKKNGVTTTSATAAYRQPGSYFCSDACTEGYTKTTNKKTVSVAVQDDEYSLAVASRKSAYAKAGALSDFSKKERKTINKALEVEAYASAGRKTARAEAFANAFAEFIIGGSDTSRVGAYASARANSRAKATACVGSNCLPKPPVVAQIVVVRDCDRQERIIGFFKFPVCEYRTVKR